MMFQYQMFQNEIWLESSWMVPEMWIPGAYTIKFCYFIQHEEPNDALQNYFIYFGT